MDVIRSVIHLHKEIIYNVGKRRIWVLGWSVTWAVKEFTKRRKCREYSLFAFQERVRQWRDPAVLRGGGFELLLDYNWIKKVEGGELLLCGPWAVGGVVTGSCSLFQCYLLPVAIGISFVFPFQ